MVAAGAIADGERKEERAADDDGARLMSRTLCQLGCIRDGNAITFDQWRIHGELVETCRDLLSMDVCLWSARKAIREILMRLATI